MNKSGQEIGDENVAKLKTYLDSLDTIPARNGKAHISAIAEAARIDRQALYKNPRARQLVEEAVAKKGLRGIVAREEQEDSRISRLEIQVSRLEQKNSTLLAENWELRRELKKLRHIEILIEDGKRVIP